MNVSCPTGLQQLTLATKHSFASVFDDSVLMITFISLRVSVCNDREPSDSCENRNCSYFAQILSLMRHFGDLTLSTGGFLCFQKVPKVYFGGMTAFSILCRIKNVRSSRR